MHLVNRSIFYIFFVGFTLMGFAQNTTRTEVDALSTSEMEAYIKQLGDQCWSLREKNQDSSLLIGKEALALAVEFEFKQEIPRLCNFLGVVYLHYLHDYKSAIPYFHQAIEGFLSTKDSIQLAYTYNNLGDAFMFSGNVELALNYAENSLGIFTNLNDTIGLAYGYINLALVYRAEKNYELALEYFNKVREMREKVDDKTGLASVMLELAITHQHKGDLDKAGEVFDEAYQLHLDINNVRYAAYCLNGMADNYYLQKEYDKAYEHFMHSIRLNQQRNYLYGQIDSYIGLALVYAEQNKKKEGETALRQALDISIRLGIPFKILETYETYAKFYRRLNDYKKATESLGQFLSLYDSILSIQQLETFHEIQNNFLVSKRLGIARQELETRRIEEKYLLIIIALTVILAVVFFWRFVTHRKMNLQLQRTNQVKDKLFSVISHDLKTPFNSLVGFSEILKEELEEKDYENAERYAGIINHSAEESLKMLNNLLNWSRTQTGRIEYQPENISIAELFEELDGFFKSEALKYEIKIAFSNSVTEKVYGDINILRIILSNLISNALKYTKEGGLIKVNARRNPALVFIRVEDNGTGMPEETLTSLFDSSKSRSTAGLRNEKGTGLGLIICAEMIKVHKGRIRVESDPDGYREGKGSVFEISFPAG